ncbi:competence protein ComEA [Caloramator quimbayensis]|uniref:Competence protein ComEA n=2 Tax=Caloramator quimbayensis TaxID=1147123 RepID=A0A1T4XYS7_9CLOT|nr:competence protein ComEA [Caloramator quimbayensis]
MVIFMDLTRREKIGILVFSLILIFTLSFSYFKNKNASKIEVMNEKAISKEENIEKMDDIKVYITGEVKKPGVYSLKNGDRAEKAVELAGGFTERADKNSINLAMKLKDEDYIKVESTQSSSSSIQTNIQINLSNKININTADKEQLKTLPRIGDSLAERIIDFRNKNGPFKRIEDIKKVSGIGDKMFENIKDKISVY